MSGRAGVVAGALAIWGIYLSYKITAFVGHIPLPPEPIGSSVLTVLGVGTAVAVVYLMLGKVERDLAELGKHLVHVASENGPPGGGEVVSAMRRIYQRASDEGA